MHKTDLVADAQHLRDAEPAPVRVRPDSLTIVASAIGSRRLARTITGPATGVFRPAPVGTPILARDNGAATAKKGAGASAKVDGATLTTYEGALEWVQRCRVDLIGQQGDFDDGVSPGEIDTALDWAKDVATEMNAGKGDLDQSAATELESFSESYVEAHNAAQVAKAETAKARMADTKAKAAALAAQMKALEPQLRDLQRQLFREEDESKLKATADAVAGVLDCSLASKDCVEEIVAGLDSLKGYKINLETLEKVPAADSKVPKVLNALEMANKAYAAYQIVDAAIGVIGGGKTKASTTLKAIEGTATVVSAGGTLLGCAAAFGLYANLYLGPAVSAAVKGVAVIQEHTSRGWNRDMIQLGDFNSVDWSLEPGGRPMFEFMLKVMHAGNWGGVPAPVPQTILDYFEDNEDELNAGVGHDPRPGKPDGKSSMGDPGSAMPMEGMIDETPDTQRIKYWVFNNRRNLWAMFYGAAEVPAAGG